MLGLAILVGFQLLGILLHRAGVPIPGAVLGLILFTGSLFAGLVKVEWVEKSASFLLRNMLLFFAPLVVALPELSPMVGRSWLPIAASLVISLVAVMMTTGFVSHGLLSRRNARSGRD